MHLWTVYTLFCRQESCITTFVIDSSSSAVTGWIFAACHHSNSSNLWWPRPPLIIQSVSARAPALSSALLKLLSYVFHHLCSTNHLGEFHHCARMRQPKRLGHCIVRCRIFDGFHRGGLKDGGHQPPLPRSHRPPHCRQRL